MSLRLEMLQVARLAPSQLLEAADRVVDFLKGQFNTDGGVADRSGLSDVYYTVFGLDALNALRATPPVDAVTSYVDALGDGASLDFVHLTCLARCHAALPDSPTDPSTRRGILRRIERHRSHDGGYGPSPDRSSGTAYHAFLALGAYQDLNGEMPDRERLALSLESLRSGDGAYANGPGLREGSTPATAAAVTLLRQLGRPVPGEAGEWLLARALPSGGFLAAPGAPLPDLLSTATALHALAGMQVSFDTEREACLDFVDSLWTGRGFCGHWADDVVDAEYTFYALLALGHLSLS